MGHPWRSQGQRRTVVWYYEPSPDIQQFLKDMQDATSYALQVAYTDAVKDRGVVPSPIQVRREIREWFYSRYVYARHHINPVCKAAVAMLRSYKKNHHGDLRIPEVKRFAARIDGALFKLVNDRLRVTFEPHNYTWISINTKNRHFDEYSKGRPSELLITDKKVCLTFVVSKAEKLLGEELVASDLNFDTIDSTTAAFQGGEWKLRSVTTQPIRAVVQIQSDFTRRRKMLQKHVENPQKRLKKLRETRGRQRNRIRDTLQKLSTKMVQENPKATFVFENLKGIRRAGERRDRRFRASLNRWPYRMYQSFVDYKSPYKTLYASPRRTSSECPVCGGKLEHPAWTVSRCNKCGVDYDRDRLASLAILCRGLRLCGQPFAVSADTSWQQMKDEYLHTGGLPNVAARPGWTDAASAPNRNADWQNQRS